MGEQNEVRQEIIEVFKKLGLEMKEDRAKFTFGASVLDDEQRNEIKTDYIIQTPSGREVFK